MSDNKTVQFSSEDAQMEAAVRKAKETISQFFEAFFNSTERQKSFLLKVVFDVAQRREHIWLADLHLGGAKPSGVIANEPNIPSLKFMQRVEFEPSYISDWMYIDDAYLVGGYTTRVIRERMTPAERSAHDSDAPYKFREEA
jgi:uncharacterized protein YegJ (DUF2314 family)